MTSPLLDGLLIKLKIISKITTGGKINTNSDFFELDNYSFVQWLKRTISGNSRSTTIQALNELVYMIIEYSELVLHSVYVNGDSSNKSETNHCVGCLIKLNNGILKSITGWRNLKSTYREDEKLISMLELLVERLHDQQTKIKKKIDLLKKSGIDNSSACTNVLVPSKSKNNLSLSLIDSQLPQEDSQTHSDSEDSEDEDQFGGVFD